MNTMTTERTQELTKRRNTYGNAVKPRGGHTGTGAAATCQPGEQKIWRAFRSRPADDGNHRYLTNQAMYDYMVKDMGWDGEFVNFCAKP